MSGADQGPVEVGTAGKARPDQAAILINVLLGTAHGAPVDQAHKIRCRVGAAVATVAARLAAFRRIDAKQTHSCAINGERIAVDHPWLPADLLRPDGRRQQYSHDKDNRTPTAQGRQLPNLVLRPAVI
jgi:hypothetical protein